MLLRQNVLTVGRPHTDDDGSEVTGWSRDTSNTGGYDPAVDVADVTTRLDKRNISNLLTAIIDLTQHQTILHSGVFASDSKVHIDHGCNSRGTWPQLSGRGR